MYINIGLTHFCNVLQFFCSPGLTHFCNVYPTLAWPSFAVIDVPQACTSFAVFENIGLSQFCIHRLVSASPTFTGKCTCRMNHFCKGLWLNYLALQVAWQLEKGEWFVCCLCQWTKQYIQDQTNLPIHKQNSQPSHIENEELAVEIKLHLQSIGKYICAMDIIHYLEDPIVQKHYGLSQSVSLKTAQRWFKILDYQWKQEKRGQ